MSGVTLGCTARLRFEYLWMIAIKGLKSFDGRGSYREWASDTLTMISLTHRNVHKVVQGALRPGSPAAASTATPSLPAFSDMNTDPIG